MNKDDLETAVVPEAKPKRSGKKTGIIAGVLAAVVVVAGAGFWVWHETPGFCGAICHTPMDPYLATYEQSSGATGVDKWGNEVEDAGGMLAVTHREAGEECLSCHVPTMSEQISEGVAWVTGSYEVVDNETYGVVIPEASLDDLTEARGLDGDALCLNDACHTNADGSAMTRDDLAAITADYEHNPHVSQHGEVACSDCHKAHRASVMQCTQCHGDAEVPEGWLSASDAKKLANQA